MTNLFYLLKVNTLNYIGINKFMKEENKSEKLKSIFIVFTIGFVMVMLAFSSYMLSSQMAPTLNSMGMLKILLINSVLSSTLICFFMSIYNAQGILFSSRAYNILMPLPIKSSTILASKVLWLLLFNYFFELFIFIPQCLVYFNNTDTSPIFLLYLIIGFLFIPLIPAVIASILAFMLSYFSSKIRHSNLFIILFSFILLIGVMIGSFKFNDVLNSVISNSNSILHGIKKIYIPAYYFSEALDTLNIISLIKFVAISIIPFIIFLIIFNNSFNSLVSKLGESYKRPNYKLGKLKSSSPVVALLKKECKRYFSSYIYVLNTLFGMVLIVALSIASLFISPSTLESTLQIPLREDILPMMVLALLCGSVFMSCTTSSSISLEGKNLWILQSSPISEIDIFKGKIGVNLLITIPAIILSALLFTIGFKLNLINLLWMILLPTLCAFLTSMIGLIVNLYLPKLEWSSDTAVVKQSASVLISMLFSFAFAAISIGMFIYFEITAINLYFIILSIILLILILSLWILLKNIGTKLFKKLS